MEKMAYKKMEAYAEERQCRDCIFYVEHYVKDGAGLLPVMGHCTREQADGQLKRAFRVCEDYDERDKDSERKELIRFAIDLMLQIAQQLEELKLILKSTL